MTMSTNHNLFERGIHSQKTPLFPPFFLLFFFFSFSFIHGMLSAREGGVYLQGERGGKTGQNRTTAYTRGRRMTKSRR